MDAPRPSRRDKSLATRRKILAAAHHEFLARGFHGATISAIAQRAEVAVQTVYFVFNTKAALISAAIDAAVLGDDQVDPVDSEWWRAMVAQPDPAAALRTFIRGSGPIFERAGHLALVLRAASLADEEVRKTNDHHDHLQRMAFGAAVEVICAKGPLRADLTPESATDVLLTVLSDSAYYQFTHDHGWSHDEVIRWWCEAIPLVLLPDLQHPTGV